MQCNTIKLSLLGFICLGAAACVPQTPVSTPDTTPPVLAQVTAVMTPSGDTTPAYTFSSNEAGIITYGGDCSSATLSAIKSNNTITFDPLSVGIHNNCTVTVTDAVGNNSLTLSVSSFTIVPSMPLNDTGITTCGDYAEPSDGYSGTNNRDINCADVGATQTVSGTEPISNDLVPAGQDAVYGRDAQSMAGTLTKIGGGYAGFDYTKLGSDGLSLAIQNKSWSDGGNEGAGTQWSCVKDNVTGLIWEVKTNDNGFRDKDWTYSWYNSYGLRNGGNAGTADGGDNCSASTQCDIERYLTAINSRGLCGSHQWNIPSMGILMTLQNINGSVPTIDTDYFPHTVSDSYWTSSSTAFSTSNAWVVRFSSPTTYFLPKSELHPIRLFRKAK